MKNILLLVHDDEGQEARLQAALDLARALDGHLSCVDVTVLPMLVADIYAGADQMLVAADVKEGEARHKAALQIRLAQEDVPWDWVDVVGNMAASVLDVATLADLIVLNRQLDGFPHPDMHEIASRIVMHARAPVVAVPEDKKRFATERAFIAWDGSASCAATMRACVPLLALASEVRLFCARDKSVEVAPEAAARYLSRHGVHATVQTIDRRGRNADQLIAIECAQWEADYVVMGAYGHGRLRETFGGVTKRLLSSSKVPLVLAH